jgi:hypothetical protein
LPTIAQFFDANRDRELEHERAPIPPSARTTKTTSRCRRWPLMSVHCTSCPTRRRTRCFASSSVDPRSGTSPWSATG